MRGDGPYWEAIKSLFEVSRLRYGLAGHREEKAMDGEREVVQHPSRRGNAQEQLELWA